MKVKGNDRNRPDKNFVLNSVVLLMTARSLLRRVRSLKTEARWRGPKPEDDEPSAPASSTFAAGCGGVIFCVAPKQRPNESALLTSQ